MAVDAVVLGERIAVEAQARVKSWGKSPRATAG
jgi:hypothetical protein